MEKKICAECGEERVYESYPCGQKRWTCVPCRNRKAKERRERCGDDEKRRHREYSKKWSEKNPEKRRAIQQRYADSNRGALREKSERRRVANQDYYTKKSYEWKKKNPHKRSAQRKLQWAVKTGKIERPNFCSICKKKCSPCAHHENYDEPYSVSWLCKLCHGKIHGLKRVSGAIKVPVHVYEVKSDFDGVCKKCGEKMELKEYSSGRRDWLCRPCERKRLMEYKKKKKQNKTAAACT